MVRNGTSNPYVYIYSMLETGVSQMSHHVSNIRILGT